jgi:hypothetical protein
MLYCETKQALPLGQREAFWLDIYRASAGVLIWVVGPMLISG